MTFAYDDQVAALVAKDAASIDEVVAKLQGIDALLDGTRDGLKWFNTLYLEVTLAVKDRVARNDFSGGTAASAYIATLDFTFANLYFAALRGWLSGGSLPESWRVMLEQRGNARLARIQFALAGVNAHINRDLAVAVVNICEPRHGTVDYDAYTEVNATLDSLIQRAETELMVSLPGDVLPGAAQVEMAVAAWSVGAARESAWVHAEVLQALGVESEVGRRFIESVDGTAALAGKALLLAAPR
jgi:hypothetical protein